jgi:hypothetical protein
MAYPGNVHNARGNDPEDCASPHMKKFFECHHEHNLLKICPIGHAAIQNSVPVPGRHSWFSFHEGGLIA